MAGLPTPPAGRSQRRADRLGHRPGRQPQPLRLSAQHHAQPDATGRGEASGTTWPWRRPPGPIPSHSSFFTGHGRSSSIPSGSIRSTPRSPPWPSTWPRGAIRPPGSRRTPRAAVTRSGLDRGFAHFEDYPLTPRSLLGRTVAGKLDPRESSSSRRLLRHPMDPASSPATRATQRRLPRLAGPSPARSPLLRLPELLRRPRPLRAPAGIRGPFRDPAPDTPGLPVPARLCAVRAAGRFRSGTS